MLTLFDNGSHRVDEEGYFEWWYFHFVAPNGDVFNIVLHETDIFGLTKAPYISLSLLPRGGKPEYFRVDIERDLIERNTDYLKAGSYIQETKDTISLRIKFSPEMEVDVGIKKTLPPLYLNEGVLYATNPTYSSNWVVEVARADYEGEIARGTQKTKVEGIAYHDHQWGLVPIQNYVKDWIWGHFSNDDQTHIFFYIVAQDGQNIMRYIHTEGDKVATSLGLSSPHLWLLAQDATPEKANSKTFIQAAGSARLLSFGVSPEKLFRARVNESHGSFASTYLRWEAEATYNSIPLRGITEYMRIR